MAAWEVARTQGTCARTGRVLQEGEEFYAVLYDTPEGFVRHDYAVDAWTEPPENAFSFWKSRIPHKEQKKRTLVNNEVLVDFFERLADEDDLPKVQFRFVLALMLMRKRVLRYDETKWDDGVETWTMTLTTDNTTHTVVNPQLGDDEIESASQQLTAILHGDFLAEHGEQLSAAPAASEPESDSKPDADAEVDIPAEEPAGETP